MDFNKTTIFGLFNSGIQFTIPVYQRAYSWQRDNWIVFLEDIKQQASRENPYSFGNLLLETITKDRQYDVVDGQQRLTTIVIFMRALYNVMKTKGTDQETLDELAEFFFKKRSNIKLRPVENDRACFDAVIVENMNYTVSSPSQQCMVDAKIFFEKELSGMEIDQIKKIKDLILESTICRLEMNGKKEAALMFELQNNRGRDLTNMEKLKSYFMYQMYVESPSEETDANVEQIANYFKDIYKTIYDIKNVSEDSILIYHCFAYLNVAFGYRNMDDISKIVIGEGITHIGNTSFTFCAKVTSVTLPSTLESIGVDAFSCCEALTSVTIPANVTEIKEHAFDDCSALATVTVEAVKPPVLGREVFRYIASNAKFIVPAGSEAAYKADKNWQQYFKGETGISSIDAAKGKAEVKKVFRNGRLCIGNYTIAGQRVQ